MSLRNAALDTLRRFCLSLLLGIAAVSAHAMPGSSAAAAASGSAAEPLACLVLDAQAPTHLKLNAEQIGEWQRLQQQHAQLFGERCQGADSSSVMPTRNAANARATQVYRKEFLDFLTSLSVDQRSLLEEIARARREGRAALEEKLIRHRLML